MVENIAVWLQAWQNKAQRDVRYEYYWPNSACLVKAGSSHSLRNCGYEQVQLGLYNNISDDNCIKTLKVVQVLNILFDEHEKKEEKKTQEVEKWNSEDLKFWKLEILKS